MSAFDVGAVTWFPEDSTRIPMKVKTFIFCLINGLLALSFATHFRLETIHITYFRLRLLSELNKHHLK